MEKFRVVPRSHPTCPLVFYFLFGDGNRRAFRLPGEGGDHFHCAEEPLPSHIRCRISAGSRKLGHAPQRSYIQGNIIYTAPPLTPFWPEGFFQGQGCGYFEAPRQEVFMPPPLFYTPPTPKRVSDIWPRSTTTHACKKGSQNVLEKMFLRRVLRERFSEGVLQWVLQ